MALDARNHKQQMHAPLQSDKDTTNCPSWCRFALKLRTGGLAVLFSSCAVDRKDRLERYGRDHLVKKSGYLSLAAQSIARKMIS